MGRLRKRPHNDIGRRNKYPRKKDVDVENENVIENEEPNEMDGENMYNRIRAMRDKEASEMKTLGENTINNVQTYINDINSTIEEAREFEDEKYEYLGAVYSLNDLTKLSVFDILKRGKVPYVWVVDRNIFMYYVNGIWSDDKTIKDWVVVYKDDDLALKTFNGEVRMLLFKDIEDIEMDNNKIANILSIVSGINVDVVENVIECVENGWEPEAIMNLNDGEIANDLVLEDIERIIEDYNYWNNLGFNRVQVDYDLEVEDDEDEVDLVELVTDNQEGVNVEEVAPLLQTMNMAEIYNEIVEERNQQEEDESLEFIENEEIPFNAENENYDELIFDDLIFDEDLFDDEIEFNEDDELDLDDEIEFDEDEIEFNEDDFVYEDELEDVVEEVNENAVPQMNVAVVADLYASGYILATNREGSLIPAIFNKVDDIPLNDMTNISEAELVMDDTLGSDKPVFEDQDLLAILKVRVSALMNLQNSEGEYVFKDDKCLNNVLDKLTEAQMWLELWTKLN